MGLVSPILESQGSPGSLPKPFMSLILIPDKELSRVHRSAREVMTWQERICVA